MKKIVLYISLVLLSACIFAGCHPSNMPELNRADDIMEESPDSALNILRAIDTASLSSKADKALYHLLLTQAEVKCNVPVTDSAGICCAVDYFSEHGTKRNLMRARFYEGVTMYYLSQYQKSVRDALEVYDLAVELDDIYWQAKATELISDNFSKNFNPRGALPYSEKAAKLYEKSGRHLNHLFSLCDNAIELGSATERIRSEHIIDSIYDIAQNELGDSALMAYCLDAQIDNVRSLEKYDRVFDIYKRLVTFNKYYSPSSNTYYALCRAYTAKHDFLMADSVLDLLRLYFVGKNDSVFTLQSEMYLAETKGEYEKAYQVIKNILNHNYNVTRKILEQSVTSSQRDYFSQKAKLEKAKSQRIKTVIAYTLSILLIIAFLVAYIIHMRFQHNEMEKERKVAEILNLTSDICRRKEENLSLYAQIRSNETERERKIAEITDLTSEIRREKEENITLSDRIRSNEIDIEKKTTEIIKLTNIIDYQRKKIREDANTNKNTEIAIFSEKWKQLNSLCGKFYEMRECPGNNSTIYNEIENELKKIQSDEEIAKVEKTLNNQKDNIITKIKEECAFLKKDDVKFLTFIIAGFSYRALCLLFDLKRKNFYQKKSRLIERIANSNAKHKDEFIRALKGDDATCVAD